MIEIGKERFDEIMNEIWDILFVGIMNETGKEGFYEIMNEI